MKKIAVIFCVFFSFASVALSQVAQRTVTNADLEPLDRKSTRLNSSHTAESRMPSSA